MRSAFPGHVRPAILLAIGTVALLLAAPALLNGFPFVFMDTTDYIILTPRLYRSPFYQMFVFATGLKRSIWMPVAIQAILSSVILWHVLAPAARGSARRFLAAAVPVAIVSTLPIFTGFVMPDVFTGLMFAALFVLAVRWPALTVASRVLLGAIALLAIMVHLSHLVMAAAILAFGVAIRLAGGRFIAWRGLIAGIGCVVAAAAMGIGYNAAVFGKATVSPAGSTFLLANLIEYGPARRELHERCPAAGYRLCGYVDRLPATANELLWQEGPLTALGGFAGMREESGRIVAATLSHRSGEVLAVSAANTVRALGHVAPATDVVPFADEAKIAGIVGDVYGPHARAAFVSGLQERDRFPRRLFDALALGGLAAALLSIVVGGAIALKRGRPGLLVLPAFSLVVYLGNALTCATLSGVYDRYQSRVSWLIVAGTVHLVLGLRASADDPDSGQGDGYGTV